MSLTYWRFVLLSCFCWANSHARTLIVPDSFATIQIALDSLAEFDTVYVRYGLYVESLVTPALSFVMIGEANPDSTENPYPVIDPSALDHSTELGCLRLLGRHTELRNLTFRNGAAMYPRNSAVTGGVSANDGELRVTNCIFDSTNVGVFSDSARVWLDSCQFLDNQWAALWTDLQRVTAINSLFSGQGFRLVACADSSRFTNCQFRDNTTGYLINVIGTGHVFTLCEFGPYGPWPFSIIGATDFGADFIHCIFRDCETESSTIGIARRCDARLRFIGNLFLENRIANGASATAGVAWGCSSGQGDAIPVVFENNRFEQSIGSRNGKCINASFGGAILTENRFLNNGPSHYSTVHAAVNPCALQRNVFVNNDFAFSSHLTSNARNNYWGDSTGPYHPSLNPNGLGDRVSDSVLFDPWYSDTSFLINSVDNRIELPGQVGLAVFPNPFNNTLSISLEVPLHQEIAITLYDLLGREVDVIHRGRLNSTILNYTAPATLASGIYFLRAATANQTAMQKVVLLK